MEDVIVHLERIEFILTVLLISSCALVGLFLSYMVVMFVRFRDLL